MAAPVANYSVDDEISEFFAKTSTDQQTCNLRAEQLVGGIAQPVAVQGVCSYTVYADPSLRTVVQFRLRSLPLPLETVNLASKIYGSIVPQASFDGQLGEEVPGKEPLYIYIMTRMSGVSRIDYILSSEQAQDHPDGHEQRMTLIRDVARFFSLSWKSPVQLDSSQIDALKTEYEKDLRQLLVALPDRFQSVVQRCLTALPLIMKLPMVLTHKDFGDFNILVDPKSCHLLGVIDWAEAKVEPFGINLYSVQNLMSQFNLRTGWKIYQDRHDLSHAFWQVLEREAGGWSERERETIQTALILGALRSWGFTSRLANMPEPIPISEGAGGAYKMLRLDGLLVNPETKFI